MRVSCDWSQPVVDHGVVTSTEKLVCNIAYAAYAVAAAAAATTTTTTTTTVTAVTEVNVRFEEVVELSSAVTLERAFTLLSLLVERTAVSSASESSRVESVGCFCGS